MSLPDSSSFSPPDWSDWRVLVVDDEVDSTRMLRIVLENAGAKVFVASDGQEALDLFDSAQPTLVLADLSMPVLNGWDLLREIRLRQSTEIKVIAVTAHAMKGDRENTLQAGFDGYFSKPLTFATFYESLIEQLDL